MAAREGRQGGEYLLFTMGLDPAHAVGGLTVSALARRIAAAIARERDLLTRGCVRVTGAAVRDPGHSETRWPAGNAR
jgi:hypothetical protein